MKRLFACSIGLISAALLYGQTPRPQQRPVAAAPSAAAQRSVIDQYCVSCHNEKTKAGSLALDKADIEHVGENAETWEKVVRKLRAGMMPPLGFKRPDAAT